MSVDEMVNESESRYSADFFGSLLGEEEASGKSSPQFSSDLCANVSLSAHTVARLRKNLEKKKFRVSPSHKGKTKRACICAEIPRTSVR